MNWAGWLNWIKSSLSFANGNCVELAALGGMVLIRDSKNPDGPWLRFDGAVFGEFLAAQPDLSPKAWPRYVWLADRLPTTATNKILKRELTARGTTPGSGVVWTRFGRSGTYEVEPSHRDT